MVLDFSASPGLVDVARLLYQVEVLLLQPPTPTRKVTQGFYVARYQVACFLSLPPAAVWATCAIMCLSCSFGVVTRIMWIRSRRRPAAA